MTYRAAHNAVSHCEIGRPGHTDEAKPGFAAENLYLIEYKRVMIPAARPRLPAALTRMPAGAMPRLVSNHLTSVSLVRQSHALEALLWRIAVWKAPCPPLTARPVPATSAAGHRTALTWRSYRTLCTFTLIPATMSVEGRATTSSAAASPSTI